MSDAGKNYELLEGREGVPVKAWVKGVPFEEEAKKQLLNVARLPFVYRWVAAMPDVHLGIGATVGSVIPTVGAIIPAAVGVDIGCGMMATLTTLVASELPDDLKGIRSAIERAVPHGRTNSGGRGDRGAWGDAPDRVAAAWSRLEPAYRRILDRHPSLDRGAPPVQQLGTLGTGNHFIEVCLDEKERVWFLLHSGSRGVGNRIGTQFIEIAKKDMRQAGVDLPDRDLAYLEEGTSQFRDYVEGVGWAQSYAATNRVLMMERIVEAVAASGDVPPFTAGGTVVNCHHNYVAKERHFGREVFVTRKGAVRAGKGELGIVPGSMGARSYIVRGLGNPESFESCSHGAGRRMSRGEARRRFTVADHEEATRGVECRKDSGVLDETPAAYKSIDAVMAAQRDLAEPVETLRQVVCVKG
ncbi:MAG TPA: RtcB family protein [Thermoanaerobaculia bacterium]|nr:RtcB family protein [Thermoanaerobaculia bacterium]